MNPNPPKAQLNELKLFELSQKRTRIAMHEWMRTWRLPTIEPLRCPHCGYERISKRFYTKEGNTHHCSACCQDFSMEEVPGCRCTFPGGLLKCFDCQHHQAMMAYVEQRLPELQKLTEQQLDSIIEHPNFYQRDLNRYSSQVGSKDKDDLEWHHDPSGTRIQLSFFDDVDW